MSSSEAIKGLQPETLWQQFYGISQVPRPSKKEAQIIAYLENRFTQLGLSYRKDAVGNLVASVPATRGHENAPTVVLQGHCDMVCEKNKGTQHDFDKDPIALLREGDWLTADGTTLGADNGIGVAAALAIAMDPNAIHGPLEILVTVDEETGLTGANNLAGDILSGKYLLNLDSEEDGVFYVGCSGGMDTLGVFTIWNEPIDELPAFTLMVSGLKGGHSGLEIHTGRANAIKLLARTLQALEVVPYHLSHIKGGNLRNAIPREAEATISFAAADLDQVKAIIEHCHRDFLNEFKTPDGGVKVSLEPTTPVDSAYTHDFADLVVDTLLALPHGVIAMSPDIAELVETSTNLATVTDDGRLLRVGTSQRSSVESAKAYIAESVGAIFSLAGAAVERGDGYPGWKPDMDSPLLKTSRQAFENLFHQKPEIKAIHAGLECGILGGKYPGLDMISFGPTITGAHSPDERIHTGTVVKFYDLLKEVLRLLAG